MFIDKKILLACAKNTTEYIKNNNGGNFTGFIVDIIRYVNKQKMDSKQKAGQLWRILFNVKNSNIEIIGGGKSIKESYIKFIDEFLCIKKIQNEYKPQNADFCSLDLDEISYVFAWVRRLVKYEKEKVNMEEQKYVKNDVKHGRGKRESEKREKEKYIEPFNTQLAEQLKKLNGSL
ncbi:MAG: hypothetical protein GXX00_00395 [Hungateiclostridium thermocellum]|nr:hypothetical protein [Acetivibrio thermocellus]